MFKRFAVTMTLVVLVARSGQATDCSYDLAEISAQPPRSLPAKPECSCPMPKMLYDIWARTPEQTAQLSFQHGNRRLYAVATLASSPYTPGVEDPELRASLGEYLILGTQEVPDCYEHLRRMLLARQFALEYNLTVLLLVQAGSP